MPASLSAGHSSIFSTPHENRVGLRAVNTSANKPKPPLHLVDPEGQLSVHTAPYRGSFSVVLSEAIRSAGLGSRVLVAQFLKGGVGQGPQGRISLCGKLEWIRPDVPCCLGEQALIDDSEKDELEATQAVQAIWEVCREKLLSGNIDQLVLDEVGLAIAHGYIEEQDLISALDQRSGRLDVILTGPSIPKGVISMADQVTELRCGK